MKAPDKIYLHPDDRHWWHEGNKTDDRVVEYIRKDALMEWLEYEKEWFEGTDIEPHYQKVIDKLNKM